VGLGYQAALRVRETPSGGIRPNTVASPPALTLSADLAVERRVGDRLWLDLVLRAGTFTETPAQAFVGNVFVDGRFATLEIGVAHRVSRLVARLTVGASHVDLDCSRIGGDVDQSDGVSSWGVTGRPELALELGGGRGLSFRLALGVAATFLAAAEGPLGEVYLALGIGGGR
jgi:hypothetical protein